MKNSLLGKNARVAKYGNVSVCAWMSEKCCMLKTNKANQTKGTMRELRTSLPGEPLLSDDLHSAWSLFASPFSEAGKQWGEENQC